MKYLGLLLILIGCIECPAQVHQLAVSFSEGMDTTSLRSKENYTVYDSDMNEIEILRTGLIEGIDSIVVLELPGLNYKTNFIVRVTDVKDRAGNLIDQENNSAWFYFDGFDPEAENNAALLRKK